MKKPEDEDFNPDSETYAKLIKLTGGMKTFVIFVLYVLFQKYWESYTDKVNAEFAANDPSKQSELHNRYIIKVASTTIVLVFTRQLRKFIFNRQKRYLSSHIVT